MNLAFLGLRRRNPEPAEQPAPAIGRARVDSLQDQLDISVSIIRLLTVRLRAEQRLSAGLGQHHVADSMAALVDVCIDGLKAIGEVK
jgi:hypothetical protein